MKNDDIEDLVIIIKGTNRNQIITDEHRGQLDLNQRGIIVLFNKNEYYELALKNYDCFYSENEAGGVYFATELSIEINNNNLYIHYGHRRYGYWEYNFRYKSESLERIFKQN